MSHPTLLVSIVLTLLVTGVRAADFSQLSGRFYCTSERSHVGRHPEPRLYVKRAGLSLNATTGDLIVVQGDRRDASRETLQGRAARIWRPGRFVSEASYRLALPGADGPGEKVEVDIQIFHRLKAADGGPCLSVRLRLSSPWGCSRYECVPYDYWRRTGKTSMPWCH